MCQPFVFVGLERHRLRLQVGGKIKFHCHRLRRGETFENTLHQFGHAWAARRVGYPMTGLRYRGVLAASLYPRNEPELPADIQESLQMIRRNVELEARLIDDLLDLTRITKGKAELDRRDVDLRTVIERAAEVCLLGDAAPRAAPSPRAGNPL